MDGRNLHVFYAYHTDKKGVIMNSVVLEDFPLERLVTGADMGVVKERLAEVSRASEEKLAQNEVTRAGELRLGGEEVKNMVVMDWRWMDRAETSKARGRRRDVRV